MAFAHTFVFFSSHTLSYTFIQPDPDVVRSAAQRAFGNAQRLGHLFVVLDLVVTFVKVVIENQVTLSRRQHVQAQIETLMFGCHDRVFERNNRCHFDRDLFAPDGFQHDMPRDSVEISRGLAAVAVPYIPEPRNDAVDGFVREIFGIVQPFRNKHPHQT